MRRLPPLAWATQRVGPRQASIAGGGNTQSTTKLPPMTRNWQRGAPRQFPVSESANAVPCTHAHLRPQYVALSMGSKRFIPTSACSPGWAVKHGAEPAGLDTCVGTRPAEPGEYLGRLMQLRMGPMGGSVSDRMLLSHESTVFAGVESDHRGCRSPCRRHRCVMVLGASTSHFSRPYSTCSLVLGDASLVLGILWLGHWGVPGRP